MKTKTSVLFCFFLCVGLTQLSAQTSTWVETIVGNEFDISIVCNNEEVDILNFPMYFELRIREHKKNGEFVWGKYLLNNVLYTSKITGEVFKAQDQEKENEKGFFTWRMNLNGNMGHHYIIKMVFETTNWEIIEYNSICH